jgi:methionyl-tRNA formyltransferase
MYAYAATDPRLARGRYFYPPFGGSAFLVAYRDERAAVLARLAVARPDRGSAPATPPARPGPLPRPGDGDVVTTELLLAAAASDVASIAPWLAILTRKYEVGRVLRASYDRDLRPIDRSEIPLDSYALFAALLARRAGSDPAAPDLGTLSSLLKVGDLLCHALRVEPGVLSSAGTAAAGQALTSELALVDAVSARGRHRPPVADEARTVWADARGVAATRNAAPASSGVTLLASDTARARAYLHLLAADGLQPDRAILVELAAAPTAGQPRPTPLFDNVTQLVDALARAAVPTTRFEVERLEDAAVLAALAGNGPGAGAGTVVVAAPSGVILAPAFFRVPGARYLHVHPGRLPAYRGSTPMYYELLAEGRLTATALFLDEGIDTGTIVAAQGFAPPADLTSIDQSFDPWMRAVLMRNVIRAMAAGEAVSGQPQEPGEGRTYFVIHPVLRHVALLGR